MGACLQLRVHTPMPPMQWEGVMAPFWVDFLISELGRPGTVDVVPDCWVLLAHLFEMCLCSNYPPMNLLIFLFETLKNYSMFLSYRGGFSIPPDVNYAS